MFRVVYFIDGTYDIYVERNFGNIGKMYIGILIGMNCYDSLNANQPLF